VAIVGNRLNGILIEGYNNRSQVTNNHLIGFNGEAGVKVEKEAFPHVVGNKVYKNQKEGILVVESSNCVVEKNHISHNIEANVAMGGKHSHHSAVIDNLIADSPGTGLYLVRSGRLRVLRNDFTRNQDAIILMASQPEIQRNHLY
jgi:parallel beta-helix repeat protein